MMHNCQRFSHFWSRVPCFSSLFILSQSKIARLSLIKCRLSFWLIPLNRPRPSYFSFPLSEGKFSHLVRTEGLLLFKTTEQVRNVVNSKAIADNNTGGYRLSKFLSVSNQSNPACLLTSLPVNFSFDTH